MTEREVLTGDGAGTREGDIVTPLEVATLRDEAVRAHSDLTPGDPSDKWSQADVYIYAVPHMVAVEKLCDEVERLRVGIRELEADLAVQNAACMDYARKLDECRSELAQADGVFL